MILRNFLMLMLLILSQTVFATLTSPEFICRGRDVNDDRMQVYIEATTLREQLQNYERNGDQVIDSCPDKTTMGLWTYQVRVMNRTIYLVLGETGGAVGVCTPLMSSQLIASQKRYFLKVARRIDSSAGPYWTQSWMTYLNETINALPQYSNEEIQKAIEETERACRSKFVI